MEFPKTASLTLTNACNMRCRMCGQWNEKGSIKNGRKIVNMPLNVWIKAVDELASHGIKTLVLRGGETFMYPDIIQLLEYINSKGIFSAIDSNGTLLEKYARDICAVGNIHITVSVDGTEKIHDYTRGLDGSFQQIKRGFAAVKESAVEGKSVSLSINFTISPHSYRSLGSIPDVARELGVNSLSIVPYYYVPPVYGRLYEDEMKSLGCPAYSWKGFESETSGVDTEVLLKELSAFRSSLGDIFSYPYLPLSDDEYVKWFGEYDSTVKTAECPNSENHIDIQPDGSINFCVDFPDYTAGNINDSTISEIYNSEKSRLFRKIRKEKEFGVCRRCGAKYMGLQRGD